MTAAPPATVAVHMRSQLDVIVEIGIVTFLGGCVQVLKIGKEAGARRRGLRGKAYQGFGLGG
jgi:hypothetical protein